MSDDTQQRVLEAAGRVFAERGYRDATVREICSAADVNLDIDTLGSLYLGGGHAVAAANGGRITGSEPDVIRLSRMFRSDTDPWCPEVF